LGEAKEALRDCAPTREPEPVSRERFRGRRAPARSSTIQGPGEGAPAQLLRGNLAEGEGFEPPERCRSPDS
jgi:hypothetical protein